MLVDNVGVLPIIVAGTGILRIATVHVIRDEAKAEELRRNAVRVVLKSIDIAELLPVLAEVLSASSPTACTQGRHYRPSVHRQKRVVSVFVPFAVLDRGQRGDDLAE